MDILQQANHYQEMHTDRANRPRIHFSVPVGWLNDPNGFSFFGDQVHLFYQYHPYATKWSLMYWGHAVSRDFLHWTDLPVALAPDQPYDSAGCFSGSAITQGEDQFLIYTGVEGIVSEDGFPHGPQQQCLAHGRGIVFEKYENNPIIPSSLLPPGFLLNEFRDPKVWQDTDGFWLLAAATRQDGQGSVLLYHSPDLLSWSLHSVPLENDGRFGTMWECPDYFSFGDEDIILISVIGMNADLPDIHDDNPVLAFRGHMDREKKHFEVRTIHELDQGRDFYATQTLQLPDGRRILIAWMQSGHNILTPPGRNWQGVMTVPRELFVKDGCLCQKPVRELEAVWEDATDTRIHVSNVCRPDISGNCLDLTIRIDNLRGSRLETRLAEEGSEALLLIWEPEIRRITFDRSHGRSLPHDRFAVQQFFVPGDGHPTLRILLDRGCFELFVNGGRQVFSALFEAPQEAAAISFSAEDADLCLTANRLH